MRAIGISLMILVAITAIAYAGPCKWISGEDFVEEYDRLVRDADGKILIMIMHAKGTTNEWGVFQNGAGRGDYLTQEQAKTAAEAIANCR